MYLNCAVKPSTSLPPLSWCRPGAVSDLPAALRPPRDAGFPGAPSGMKPYRYDSVGNAMTHPEPRGETDVTDREHPPVETLPPLKPAWFHILLALSDGALHGYAIREAVDGRTGGRVKLYPANLYGSVREMAERGLLEPLSEEEQPDEDQRRQYYRLTPRGRELLRLEADRLQQLVDAARASRALAR